MERELWSELSAAVAEADASWLEPRRYVHPTAAIVRVHLWAALHDRPLASVTVEGLLAERAAAGLEPAGARHVAATADHVGSEVVLLRG